MMMFDLCPIPNTQKSFYGKAHVTVEENINNLNTYTLYSYNTPIIKAVETIEDDGICISYYRLYDGWTQTTGRHIKAFMYGFNPNRVCNKQWFEKLPIA